LGPEVASEEAAETAGVACDPSPLWVEAHPDENATRTEAQTSKVPWVFMRILRGGVYARVPGPGCVRSAGLQPRSAHNQGMVGEIVLIGLVLTVIFFSSRLPELPQALGESLERFASALNRAPLRDRRHGRSDWALLVVSVVLATLLWMLYTARH
jgi:hypothetical protein